MDQLRKVSKSSISIAGVSAEIRTSARRPADLTEGFSTGFPQSLQASTLAQSVTLLTCIRYVPISNLDRNINCPEDFGLVGYNAV
jgi:hypothetical protein